MDSERGSRNAEAPWYVFLAFVVGLGAVGVAGLAIGPKPQPSMFILLPSGWMLYCAAVVADGVIALALMFAFGRKSVGKAVLANLAAIACLAVLAVFG
jgi:hypothetical protein